MPDPKIPPQNIEAEESVLGALLIDKDAIVKIADFLQPECFYKDANGLIYQAVLNLYERRQSADVVTVANELKQKRLLKKVGGATYLSELVDKVPTSGHVKHYAEIVKEQYIRRSLLLMSANISEMCFDGRIELPKLLDKAEQDVFALSQRNLKQDFVSVKSVLAESFDRLDELHKNQDSLRGVPTGFRSLDNKLAGLQKSNMIIIAARPSQGKTSLALNIAQHISVKEKIPVGFFSLETSKEQLTDRLLAAQANVDAWKIMTGRLEEDDFTKLGEAMGELAEAPLYIDDTPGLSIMEIRTKARKLQMDKGVKLLILDYLQLARGPKSESRVVEVSLISQGLKNISRELNIPFLVLSQLSRAIEQRADRKPQLSDLRESGSIEQDADVVMFIHRPDDEQQEKVNLMIAKHRNGPTGQVDLIFKGEKTKFYEVERQRGT